ncbi:MAG: hypothetical protein DI584_09130 [Stenotrophomonas sp.]|nr:MAG: hypothetical protein DI584_09130 [Stenotrophomonas sp.]
MALTKVVGARELRRWRRAIRAHLAETYDTPRLEAEGVISAARNISWQGDVHELSLLGEVGALFVSLISLADQTIDMLDTPYLGSTEQKVSLEECLSTIREQWKDMDGSITDALTTLETFNKK